MVLHKILNKYLAHKLVHCCVCVHFKNMLVKYLYNKRNL